MDHVRPAARPRPTTRLLGWLVTPVVAAAWAAGAVGFSAAPLGLPLVGSGSASASVAGAAVPPGSHSAPFGPSNSAFTISGSVSGLYPGRSLPLHLTVTNGLGSPLAVNSITATVLNAKAGCPASNLSVSALSGRLEVPAHGRVQTTLTVVMAHSAPNACQGAIFPFRYTGLGRRQ